MSECKEVSWEIPVVPIFTSMTLVERQEEQRQGRFAGLARLFSLPGGVGDKNLGKISYGSPVETLHSPSIHQEHPSEEPSSARTDKS